MNISDKEFDENVKDHIKSSQQLLDAICSIIEKSNCSEGSILAAILKILPKAIFDMAPFFPFGVGSSHDANRETLENMDELLNFVYRQIKLGLKEHQEIEGVIH